MLLLSSLLMANEAYTVEKTVSVNVANGDVFAELINWAETEFVSSESSIVLNKPASGLLVCSSLYTYHPVKGKYSCSIGRVTYTLRAQLKGEFIELTTIQFTHIVSQSNMAVCELGMLTKEENAPLIGRNKNARQYIWNNLKESANTESNKIFISIENYLKSKGYVG